MAAYKVGAEAGDVHCQYQIGYMYYTGQGVAVDYKQARPWIEKAAAQNDAGAIGMLGVMYFEGKDVTPSYRRARELHQRAIELGSSSAEGSLQNVIESIENVS